MEPLFRITMNAVAFVKQPRSFKDDVSVREYAKKWDRLMATKTRLRKKLEAIQPGLQPRQADDKPVLWANDGPVCASAYLAARLHAGP